MGHLIKLLCLTLISGTLLLAQPGGHAAAQSLDDLRAGGQVGERSDGYLEARDGSAQGLVGSINAKRRQEFERIAGEQGISVDEVGRIAAEKIISRLPSGAWYRTSDGAWHQR